ncbi:MAG: nitroreductase family deazaflavin-dependent oxidoreductase [Acidimicrobiia bacterium]
MTAGEPGYTQPDTTLLGAEHIKRYEETGGEVGHEWNGATCLVLSTTGRKSGALRKSALIYASDGDDFLVVASMGGAPRHPQWYLNLTDQPEVTVQVRDRVFSAVAHTATPEERPRVWKRVNEVWPNYDVYATRTTREIPVVVLTPTDREAPA